MTHDHFPAGSEADVVEPCVPIGERVCLREWRRDGTLVRLLFAHERATAYNPNLNASKQCEGSIPVTGEGSWVMTGSLAGGDLTLNPSVLCTGFGGCGGIHGWVRDGKWVEA